MPKEQETQSHFVQRLVRHTYWSRVIITIITLSTFFAIVGGIGYAIWVSADISHEWKEILLLVLGAFIGSYNKVIDFWFNALERDKDMVRRADAEDDNTRYRICDCEKQIEFQNNKYNKPNS